MAVPIEGYTFVAQKARIKHLLEGDALKIPNGTALGDDGIWRCCFMAEADVQEFIQSLEKLGLNVSQGPDSDIVLVSEADCSVTPYCEWLVTARWERAVIAWKTGTHPTSVVAREGWDPRVGSGLSFCDPNSQDRLEFLRLENNIEVFLNKNTGKEVYVGRTSPPVEAIFKTAAKVIGEHLATAGEPPLRGYAADKVAEAVEMLEKVIASVPDSWNVLWYHGKGQMALGNYELAYCSLRRAYELEKNIELIPRELAGVCLELGKFDEAVAVAEQAAALNPENADLIGNLAVAYLLAGRIAEAKRSIAAAIKINQDDKINNHLYRIIGEVADGKRPQPKSLATLSSRPAKPKRRFWEFWRK